MRNYVTGFSGSQAFGPGQNCTISGLYLQLQMTDGGISWAPSQWRPTPIITHYSFLCLWVLPPSLTLSLSLSLFLTLSLSLSLFLSLSLSVSLSLSLYLYPVSLSVPISVSISLLTLSSCLWLCVSISLYLCLFYQWTLANSRVGSLVDCSDLNETVPHRLNIWTFGPQAIALFGEV